jgi:hypothetical protein
MCSKTMHFISSIFSIFVVFHTFSLHKYHALLHHNIYLKMLMQQVTNKVMTLMGK